MIFLNEVMVVNEVMTVFNEVMVVNAQQWYF